MTDQLLLFINTFLTTSAGPLYFTVNIDRQQYNICRSQSECILVHKKKKKFKDQYFRTELQRYYT